MKFRKIPVEIEAIQYTGDNRVDAVNFIGVQGGYWNDGSIKIYTLEGTMKASIGDWIIKGVNGEFYPCKPDIFAKTYEKIE